jgi:hypothetical protein
VPRYRGCTIDYPAAYGTEVLIKISLMTLVGIAL